jgi:hypothetical protein
VFMYSRRDFLKYSGTAGGALLLGMHGDLVMANRKSQVAFVSTADRKSKWKSKPKELHNSVKSINDEFVKKLKKEMEAVVSDARKVAEAEKATAEQKKAYLAVTKDPLSAAVAANPALRKVGLRFLKKWKNGFYSLPWELVNELHEEGFLWGGTFSHPDLHHFEL